MLLSGLSRLEPRRILELCLRWLRGLYVKGNSSMVTVLMLCIQAGYRDFPVVKGFFLTMTN